MQCAHVLGEPSGKWTSGKCHRATNRIPMAESPAFHKDAPCTHAIVCLCLQLSAVKRALLCPSTRVSDCTVLLNSHNDPSTAIQSKGSGGRWSSSTPLSEGRPCPISIILHNLTILCSQHFCGVENMIIIILQRMRLRHGQVI